MAATARPAAGALAAETRKLLTQPSSAITVLVTGAVTWAIGWSLARAGEPAGRPPTAAEVLVIGHNLAVLGFTVLGVLAGSSEYVARQVGTTLAAVPRRGLVLAAKATALAGFAAVAGALTLVVLLAPYPGAARQSGGLLTAAAALAVTALPGTALGLLLRQLVPALIVALAVLAILPVVLASFGWPSWWLPSDAGAALVDAATGAVAWSLRPLLVVAGWLLAAWAAAGVAFVRRDA